MTAERQLWEAAEELIAAGLAEPGTTMGHECLRAGGEFVAMFDAKNDQVIVKLLEARVSHLIEAGEANSFAPAGKVFREWAALRPKGAALTELLDESIGFVSG